MRLSQGALSLDEKVNSLFENDSLFSSRFHRIFCKSNPSAPEKLLMLAVLEDALFCLQNYRSAANAKKAGAFKQALEWIQADDRDWPFSFANICETLGFDIAAARAALIEIGRGKIARSTPVVRPARAKHRTLPRLLSRRRPSAKFSARKLKYR